MMLVKERSDCLDRLCDHSGQLHQFLAQFDLAPADARNVQQIINQSLEVLDLPLDHRQFPIGPGSASPRPLQQVNSRLDRSQGVAKLMRQDSQKLFLAAVGLPQFFLDPLSVGDIEARADVPGENAIWGEPGNPVLENPAILAVLPPQPVIHCKGRASVQCRYVGLPASLQVIGVDALGPALAHLLLDGPSSEVEPLLVEVIALLICVRAPDQDRGGIGQSSKPLLTLPKRVLGPLPLGDVLGDPGDPHDPTRPVPDREAPVPDPADCPIGTHDSVFVCRCLTAALPMVCQHRSLTVLGVDGFKVRHRPLVEGLARSAPERLVGRANVSSFGAVEFVNPEHIVDMVCQLAEALLAFPLRLLGPMALSDIPEDDHNTLDLAVRVSDGGGIVLDGYRRPIPGNEHHFILREDDLSVTDDLGNWKIVSPPGSSQDRSEDLCQGATHRLMQTPSGESCGDRIQGNHETLGIGRDHSVSDAGQGDLKPLSLRLLGLKRPSQLGAADLVSFTGCPQGPAEHGDGQPDGKESESDLRLGLEETWAPTRNQE